MTWYVKAGERILGTVIAADGEEALALAYKKFSDIELGMLTIEQRRR